MTKEQKKQLYGFGLPIILGTILLLGASYAWLQLTLNGTKDNVLKVGTLSLELDDKNSVGINGDGVVPMLDEVGLMQEPYTFTLRNNGKVDSEYTIYLEDVALSEGESPLPDAVIKYNLTKDDSELATELLSTTIVEGKRVLDTGVISAESEYIYNLKLWVDQNATREQAAGKVFKGIIKVEAKQVIEQPPTPEACFTFVEETGTITRYLCGPETVIDDNPETNTSSPIGEIISDIVIPKKIRGVDVVKLGYSSEECSSDDYCSNGWNFASFRGGGLGITSVVIPEGVKVIGETAFEANRLTTITIPKSVTTIEASAFSANKLTTITIPENVTTIGSTAFAHNKLTSIKLPSTLITIGYYAFGDNQLTNVNLSEGLKEIEDYAFNNNPLTSFTLPSSVTKMGRGVFLDNNLTNVIIKGKSSPADFESYGVRESSSLPNGSPFGIQYTSGWLKGSNCEAHYDANSTNAEAYWGDGTNPCIHWEGKN